mgnify:CR=1 FL=1
MNRLAAARNGPLTAAVAAVVLIALVGCAADAPDGTPAANGGGGDGELGVLTGPLTAFVHDRSVTLRWEEDEYKYHCLTLTQPRAGKSPVETTFCPTAKSAQTTVTIGDKPGVASVDYAWTATKGFAQGPAFWTLKGSVAPPGTTKMDPVAEGTIELGPHFNGPCATAQASATGLEEWHAAPPVTLAIDVALTTAARQTVEIITPEILVDHVTAAGSAAPGGTLSFSYTFDTAGMYVVEVNNTGGGAILNCAVYVGAAIPLIAVEVEGGAGLAKEPSEAQLASMRDKLLALTNAERATVGAGPLVLSDALNEIAQYHSNNMASQGFFAHVDPQGQGPGDRAKLFGFNGPVGENLANHSSIEGAHNGLFWSAGHRSNMLEPSWGRVGFGIGKSKNGNNLLVTENFSTP